MNNLFFISFLLITHFNPICKYTTSFPNLQSYAPPKGGNTLVHLGSYHIPTCRRIWHHLRINCFPIQLDDEGRFLGRANPSQKPTFIVSRQAPSAQPQRARQTPASPLKPPPSHSANFTISSSALELCVTISQTIHKAQTAHLVLPKARCVNYSRPLNKAQSLKRGLHKDWRQKSKAQSLK